MRSDARIFVAGHRGLVGSAILRRLRKEGFSNITVRERSEVDLRRQEQVDRLFAELRPSYVFLAAARVGGILANQSYPAQFLADNLSIQLSVIEAARRHGVEKLLFLGSTCIYPKYAPQPMSEECLLSGPLEPTNEWYAVAKIAGLKLCQAYRREYGFNAISAMPTNLYGPGDNFDLQDSHVIPALIRKFYEAKRQNQPDVEVWGTGVPRREFLYVDDLADACLFLMRHYHDEMWINVGVGADVSIAELARMVARSIGYGGTIRFNSNMPDGTPRKLLDVSRLTALGWKATTSLENGLTQTVEWYASHLGASRQ